MVLARADKRETKKIDGYNKLINMCVYCSVRDKDLTKKIDTAHIW